VGIADHHPILGPGKPDDEEPFDHAVTVRHAALALPPLQCVPIALIRYTASISLTPALSWGGYALEPPVD
jgi:hypothetical protein